MAETYLINGNGANIAEIQEGWDAESLARLVGELQRSKADLEAKQEIERVVSYLSELMRWQEDDTLKKWAERLLEAMAVNIQMLQAALYMAEEDDERGKHLLLVGAYAFEREEAREIVDWGDGVVGQAARSRRVMQFDADTLYRSASRTSIVNVHPQSLRIQPLVYNDVLEGVLEISCAVAFKDQEIRLIEQLSESIAANLMSIRSQQKTQRLYNEMQAKSRALLEHEDVMKRNLEQMTSTQEEMKHARQQMELQKNQLSALINSTQDSILALDNNFNVITFNENYARNVRQTVGVPLEVGMHLKEFVSEEEYEITWNNWRRCLTGESFMSEFSLEAGREKRFYEITLNPIKNNEEIVGGVAFVSDATERKRQEQQLVKRQQQIELTQRMTRTGYWEMETKSRQMVWSELMYELAEIPQSAGAPSFEEFARMHPEKEIERCEQLFLELVEEGKEFDFETVFITAEDKDRWVRMVGLAEFDKEGAVRSVFGTMQDVHEQKMREQEIKEKNADLAVASKFLKESNEELGEREKELEEELERSKLLFEASRDAILLVEAGEITDLNPAAASLLDAPSAEKTKGLKLLELAADAQPDALSLEARIKAFLENDEADLFECRLRTLSGKEFEAEALLSALEYHGRTMMQVVLRDITERKQLERNLQELNDSLESKVRERTDKLQQAVKELQKTENQLAETEKMAVLGNLLAGITHEMKTPLGALKAASGNVAEILPEFLRALPVMRGQLDESEFALMAGALDTALNKPYWLDARKERQARKELAAQLEAAGAEPAAEIAAALARAGIIDELELFLPLFQTSYASRAADLVRQTNEMSADLKNIGVASDKLEDLLNALRRYATGVGGETPEAVSVAEGLQVILTLYQHLINRGVELELILDETMEVMALPDELGQVWTNLINNALEAMDYSGRLAVRAMEENGRARVEIEDSGPGIPAEARPRIFESFYSTKGKGKSSGMGLDICKKIVEGYGGSIAFESAPGRTVFIVELPLIKEA